MYFTTDFLRDIYFFFKYFVQYYYVGYNILANFSNSGAQFKVHNCIKNNEPYNGL